MASAEAIRDSVHRDGYAFIAEFHVEHEALEAFESIGKIDVLEGFASVQSLTPKSETSATPNTYSGNYGLGEFPFHTDLAHWSLPPRYVVLRCEVGASSVSTRVLDGACVIDSLGEEFLYRSLVTPRRPTQYGYQLLRVFDKPNQDDGSLLRWDSLYLRAANKAAVKAIDQIAQLIACSTPLEFLLRSRGDTLIVDNWRMLHGRSSIGADSISRNVQRAYLSELK
ncbi:TauD/TfdA family dioxygenase [Nitrosomonas sp.]|uniref:TauD/TfdA family dioxygenase n=1 Tax=Nitrosomonas sp. TaxID=42353 RepID=UPI0025DF246C|nr:TauD/TfdA family dioxygenase [Nitrosomonas sp.]